MFTADDTNCGTLLHYASFCGHSLTVGALLAEAAGLDVKAGSGGRTPQQVICLQPKADPLAKPLVLAAFVRHGRLARLGREVLRLGRRGTTTA